MDLALRQPKPSAAASPCFGYHEARYRICHQTWRSLFGCLGSKDDEGRGGGQLQVSHKEEQLTPFFSPSCHFTILPSLNLIDSTSSIMSQLAAFKIPNIENEPNVRFPFQLEQASRSGHQEADLTILSYTATLRAWFCFSQGSEGSHQGALRSWSQRNPLHCQWQRGELAHCKARVESKMQGLVTFLAHSS